jgi:hypothetical protein
MEQKWPGTIITKMIYLIPYITMGLSAIFILLKPYKSVPRHNPFTPLMFLRFIFNSLSF